MPRGIARIIFSVCLFVAIGYSPVPAQDTEPGFVPLFNGTNLDGWVNVSCGPATWTVCDGKICCSGKPIGELRTTRMYQNFVLEVEWRHLQPKGNAGIFVWADAITARGQPFHRAVEVQVLDGREGEWFTSDGDVFPIHGTTMVPENGRGGMRAFPTEKRSRPSPEWNHYRIECVDGSIQLSVNGKVVTRGRECSLRKGYICLESEGSPAEFRNLRIKELPGPALPPEQIADADIGFRCLYNGTDLTHWKTTDAILSHWQPHDWQLAFTGTSTDAAEEQLDLWSDESFTDFQLIVDWRWPERTAQTQSADARPDERQAVLLLRGSETARVTIGGATAGQLDAIVADNALPEAVRAAARAKAEAAVRDGEWNRFLITVKGDHVTIVLNGHEVVTDCPLPQVPLTGPIGLRARSQIEFANIFVRPL
ncbi:MAG: DUF1080 domain-containing protein [Planctomycetales bacterium]|nr:DUF1080 domain-containing protein [Planctomycetales bacterium]